MKRSSQHREVRWKHAGRESLIKRQAQERRKAQFDVREDMGVSLADMLDLGIRAPLCFDPFEASIQAIEEVRQHVLDELILPLASEEERAGDLLPEAREVSEARLSGQAGCWALACFGTGLEVGLLNLTWTHGYRLARAFSRAYALHASEPLRALALQGVLGEIEACDRESYMMDIIADWGYATMKQGVLACDRLHRKSDVFLKALGVVVRREEGIARLRRDA